MKHVGIVAACVGTGLFVGGVTSIATIYAVRTTSLSKSGATSRTELSDIARELQELKERAQTQKVALEELAEQGQAQNALGAPTRTDAGNTAPAPEASRANSALDPKEAWAATVKEYRAAIDAHASEPRDPTWATGQEKALRGDLSTMSSTAGFEVTSVDCRMTTCVADVQFENFQKAQAQWGKILTGARPLGCGVEVVLDNAPSESDDPGRPYRTGLLFNCEIQREGRAGE